MPRVAAAAMVLLVVFATGVATGRYAFLPRDPEPPPTEDATPATPGSEARPIPLGEGADVGAWQLRVDDVVLDGTDRVLAANQFNTPPTGGRTFVLVDVSVRRRSRGPGVLRGSVVPVLATPVGRRYPLTNDCGVLPAPLDPQQPVGQGQELQGQWCWVVPDHDLPKVALRVAGPTGEAVWHALR